jgi:3-oxoacyl-[acyl-carrier protein] reductase
MSILVTDLRQHLALVTGASGGIGKATCLALASMGCSIAVHYHASTEKGNALVEELKGMGVRAESFRADLTDYEQVRRDRTPLYPSIPFKAFQVI